MVTHLFYSNALKSFYTNPLNSTVSFKVLQQCVCVTYALHFPIYIYFEGNVGDELLCQNARRLLWIDIIFFCVTVHTEIISALACGNVRTSQVKCACGCEERTKAFHNFVKDLCNATYVLIEGFCSAWINLTFCYSC